MRNPPRFDGQKQYPQNVGSVQANHPSKTTLPIAVRQFGMCNNYQSLVIFINILTLITGAINIGIVGYIFSYYKGSFRTSSFHSELTFIVAFSIAFVLTCISIITAYMTRGTITYKNIHLILSSFISALVGGFAAMILLIQLAQYGRYFVEQHDVKVFAGILGVVQAALHAISGFILYKSREEFEE